MPWIIEHEILILGKNLDCTFLNGCKQPNLILYLILKYLTGEKASNWYVVIKECGNK
jgi:hypothetical protein